MKTRNLEYANRIWCFYGAKKYPPEMSGPFVGKIKIPNMDVNCALYLLQLSSAQKWKNRHLNSVEMFGI